MEALDAAEIRRAVKLALAEDLGSGDATTLAIIPETAVAGAVLRAREALVVAGLPLAEAAFCEISGLMKFDCETRDGDRVSVGQILARLSGPARALLSAERVALNFLQRLSGIATLTSEFAKAVEGTGARILDTRKTTPGWRKLEKYAVTCGGGMNHRFGLFDMILIKDNHLEALRHEAPNPVVAAVRRARAVYPSLKIEVEADTLAQVRYAVEAGADFVLLDNMDIEQLREAVELVNHRLKTEASGGVNLANVAGIAKTGVDFISIGALTHSARSMDIGLDFEKT